MQSTNSIYKKVYVESLRNAEQYAKDAEKLIDQKSYGHALAFCILGEEELIKSLLFLTALHNIIPKEDMNALLKEISRSKRAHLIKLLLSWALSVTTIDQLKQFIAKKSEFEDQIRELIRKGKGFPEIQKKQQMKLQGLYVDIKNGKVTSPFEITEELSIKSLSTLKKSIQEVKKYAEIIENQPIARNILKLVFQKGFSFIEAL
ncbi:MAG: AbiV family abortive infection protein [Candidatus Bathyarchaeia archaeon]